MMSMHANAACPNATAVQTYRHTDTDADAITHTHKNPRWQARHTHADARTRAPHLPQRQTVVHPVLERPEVDVALQRLPRQHLEV
jgi:hypothetical protein